MIIDKTWHLLQLFADGGAASGAAGDGGAAGGAESGAESADAGQQSLLELGVPKDKIRKPRAHKASPLPEGAYRTQQQMQADTQAAAAEDTQPKEGAPSRMSWEEIKKDPEYNAEIQKIVSARLKESGQSKAALEALEPALKMLAQENGMDPENIDHVALAKAITGEYDNKALQMGVSREEAMRLDQEQRTLEQQKFMDHIQRLETQGQAMKEVFPDFDLRAEMENPTFVRLTSPGVGLSVEDAFYAVHRKELQVASMQVAAQKTAQMYANAVQSGSMRPDETSGANQSPSQIQFDYREATPQQREALKKRIREAAARGEKIYPGR